MSRKRRERGVSREIVSLGAVSVLGVMAGSLIAPVESRMVSLLAGDPVLVGATFALGAMCLFLFNVLVGRMSVFWGKKRVALLGLAAGVLYPVVYATSLNVFQYMAGRIAWALAGAVTGSIVGAIFQDLLSARRDAAEVSGWVMSARSVAGMACAVLGGYLGDVVGLRGPYWLVPLLYVASIVLFVVFVAPGYREKRVERSVSRRSVRENLSILVGNRLLFLRLFTEGVTQSHWAMEPILFPLAVYAMTGSNTVTGVVFGLMGLVAMPVLPLSGRFVDRTSPVRGLLVAFVLYTVGLFVLALASSMGDIYWFSLGAVLLSLGKAFNGPSVFRIELDNIENEYRGEFLGYFGAYDTLTGAIAALATGFLLRFLSVPGVFMAFGVFTLVGFVLGFSIYWTRK